MEIPRVPDLHPAFLPPGTPVGPWHVVSRRGRGTYGVVYRAVRADEQHSAPVALKIAVYEREPRFEREVELLSRIHHPSVPRPQGHGDWESPAGKVYPYIAMEWVEGVPLYEWAATHNPSSRQVLELLAQVTRALEATEKAGGLHRDVKGDNVLVRVADGRALLTDFGAGSHKGAAPLTWRPLPPGTPAYRSPAAWQFILRHASQPGAHYLAGPTDDLFALGVTAFRLVADEYPPSTDPSEDTQGIWQPQSGGPPPPRLLNPRVAPQLDALILRMLSVRPEARGTFQEMAEALEKAARGAGPEADELLFSWETLERGAWPAEDSIVASVLGHRPLRRDREVVRTAEQRDATARAEALRREAEELARVLAPAERAPAPEHDPRWLPWLAAFLVLALGARWTDQGPAPLPAFAQAAPDAGVAGEDRPGLADASVLLPGSMIAPEPSGESAGLEMPRAPVPGQRRPPCSSGEVEGQGGCWSLAPDCPGYAYTWRSGCYVPVLTPQGPVTSDQSGLD